MKKAGIIGGIGPESTVDYYKSIIRGFQEARKNKEELPELVINSINMYKMFNFLENDQINELVVYLSDAVKGLQASGADFAVLSANTPHLVFDQVQEKVQIPMISLVEETYLNAQNLGINRFGLLATKFTMEHDFFGELFPLEGKEIVVPTQEEQAFIHLKIAEELEYGIVNPETKQAFIDLIHTMVERDRIEGIILGCTELPLLINEQDLELPQLNTTEIHVKAIVNRIVED